MISLPAHDDEYIYFKRYELGRSWSYKMKNFRPSTKIVTVDVPDPDNFLMVLRVLKDNPEEKIDIALSPRPVDLRAVPYGNRLGHLIKQIQFKHNEFLDKVRQEPDISLEALSEDVLGQKEILRHLLGRNTDADANWIGKLVLDKEDQAWFYTDAGFESQQVQEDTELYMQVSALRLMTYLAAHDVQPEQYTLYSHEGAKDHVVCGIRHAMHKPDWSWDIDEDMKSSYRSIVLGAQIANEPFSDELRKVSIKLMTKYVSSKLDTMRLSAKDLYRPFEELVSRSMTSTPDIYVGGPYTEAWAYASQRPVRRVIGMGGFIRGDNNLFPNQFNFLVDMESAENVLKKASEGGFELTLVPTECVKCSDYDFENVAELAEQIGKCSPSTVDLYEQWADSDAKARCTPFDLLAAMYAVVPELFKTRKVSWFKDNGIIRFNEHSEARITMCWDDKQHMANNKQLFRKVLQDTFAPSAPKPVLHRIGSNM